jgi:S-adenosylmethionine decarboxylase
MDNKGYHYIIDAVLLEPKILTSRNKLYELFKVALSESNFTVINFLDYKFNSDGQGVTGIFLLSESHLSYHTYPEDSYLSIDIYTCGSDPFKTVQKVLSGLGKRASESVRLVSRGTGSIYKECNENHQQRAY